VGRIAFSRQQTVGFVALRERLKSALVNTSAQDVNARTTLAKYLVDQGFIAQRCGRFASPDPSALVLGPRHTLVKKLENLRLSI
jgi:hypothetical protein